MAKRTSKKRLCVVGLDGVPGSLLLRLAAEGVMPNVAERIGEGYLRSMRASLPEISSVSWSSFMTGTNPGQHGIFGFTGIDPDTYELRFPNFADLGAPTLWDRLGEAGARSVVLNQPSTYPARPIPGAIVSGFVAVDLSRSVQPLEHLGELQRMDYQIDIDTARARDDHDFLLADLDRTLAAREAAFDYFWDAEDWSYFQLVVTGTDRLYHFLWDALKDSSHVHHQAALDYHHRVDALVGKIFVRFDEKQRGEGTAGFWILSDHGFCAIEQEVQLNAWLQREGYLELAKTVDLTTITSRSQAFALDPGRIYLHRKGRYPRGWVEEGEVPELKAEIRAKLGALEWEGKPVVREVYDAAEIYDGPHVGDGPDLVVLAHAGFDLKASTEAIKIFGRTDLVGMHTWDDAFLLSPEPVEGEDLWIGDVTAHLEAELEG